MLCGRLCGIRGFLHFDETVSFVMWKHKESADLFVAASSIGALGALLECRLDEERALSGIMISDGTRRPDGLV